VCSVGAGSLLGYMSTTTLLPDVFGFTAFYRYRPVPPLSRWWRRYALARWRVFPGRVAGRLRITDALK